VAGRCRTVPLAGSGKKQQFAVKKKRQKLNKDTAKRTEKPFSLSYTTLHAIKH